MIFKPERINNFWRRSSGREWERYIHNSRSLLQTQKEILMGYLERNRATEFGRAHGFRELRSVEAYQKRVPLSTYEDYEDAIRRIRNGEQGILTEERVRLLSPTSGSSGATKLIPVTSRFKREFRRGISPWIFDLFTSNPDLMEGPAFWSLSPRVDRSIPSRIPVGFESDTSYLSGLFSRLLEGTIAVPSLLSRIAGLEEFRYLTLLFLLRSEELRVLSIWNPSYLEVLLRPYEKWKESLLRDIAEGRATPPGIGGGTLPGRLRRFLSPLKDRAARLERIFEHNLSDAWPRLGLISCWMDGPAKPAADSLQKRFPGVRLQPKGLITTESFISFPLSEIEQEGQLLSINSHFFEFSGVDSDGEIGVERNLLAHELEENRLYTLHVTTGGGFYRYRIFDIVRVTGFYRGIPMIRFEGKSDLISDYFGEKLSQGFVEDSLHILFRNIGLRPRFAMLAPEYAVDGTFRYVLFWEPAGGSPGATPDTAHALDSILRRNYHYDLARKMDQISPPVLCEVRHGAEAHLRENIRRGKQAGDVKPTPLHPGTGWRTVFQEGRATAEAERTMESENR